MGVSESEISIINPRGEQYKITLIIHSKYYSKDEDLKSKINLKGLVSIKEGSLIDGLLLDCNMFDYRFNNRDPFWGQKGKYRGPMGRRIEYYPPYGWIGFGLNVSGKYMNENNEFDDDWLGYDNSPGEWWVAYHGVGNPFKLSKDSKDINVAESILIDGLSKSKYNEFDEDGIITVNYDREKFNYKQKDFDLNNPDKPLKKGAYLTPFINYAEHYTQLRGEGFMFNGKRYVLVFMCRVNPKTTQIRGRVNAEWICSGTSDEIRPYRILIKEYDYSYSTDKQKWEDRFYGERSRKIEIKKD